MKKIITFILLISCNYSFATNHYWSATGSNANSGLSAGAPKQTISQLNIDMAGYAANDSVLFNRGDNFFGVISVSKSNLIFDAYGTGAKPIITGLTTISSWTSLGGNIWEAVVPGGLATLNTVVINGILTPMGRYPNIGTTNGGYNTYESWTSHSLTDTSLTGTPNWTGAQVVFRQSDFTIKKFSITNHTTTTLTYAETASGINNYGYFVQNSAATLDAQNEWYYYDASGTKKIQMYSIGNPGTIQVATIPTLVSISSFTNSTFNNIQFLGSNSATFNLINANNTTINNCKIQYSGSDGVLLKWSTFFNLTNTDVSDVNNIGYIESESALTNNTSILNNTFKRIGINPGLISDSLYNEVTQLSAINSQNKYNLISNNIIDSVGYDGITMGNSHTGQRVTKNVISNFTMVKCDGGGIYHPATGSNGEGWVVIDSNIIFAPSYNAALGTAFIYNYHTRGIYLDATSDSIQVLNNTIYDALDGIYISQARHIIIKGNTVWNCGNIIYPTLTNSSSLFPAAIQIQNANVGYQTTINNTITQNIIANKYPNQLAFFEADVNGGTATLGIIDSNYYVQPFDTYPVWIFNESYPYKQYSYAGIRDAYSGYNAHSNTSPISVAPFSFTNVGSDKSPNTAFTSNVTGVAATGSNYTFAWDGTSQITGTGSGKITSTVTGTGTVQLAAIVGAIDVTKKYVLSFKTRSNKFGNVQMQMMRYYGDYATIINKQYDNIDTSIQQHTFLISGQHLTESNSMVLLNFSQNTDITYIDDLSFYEATASLVNPNDYIHFEVNKTGTVVTKYLSPNIYTDVLGNVSTGSVTIQPFSSNVFYKGAAITTSTNTIRGWFFH